MAVGRRLRDASWAPGLVMLAVAVAFVLVRLSLVGVGNPGTFVTAGADFQEPPGSPLPLLVGQGFDGQFEYRLGLAPWDLATHGHGIVLDHGYRRSRILYPTLAYLLSGGQESALPWALIAVNVLALGACGWAAGALARSWGRPAVHGLLVAGFSGFAASLARDLTEPLAAACLLAGLLALRRNAWVWAGTAFAAAALTRETTLVAPTGVFLLRLFRRTAVGRPDASWLLPAAAFAGWQALNALRYGSLPLLDDNANSGIPFVGIVGSLRRWVLHPTNDRVTVLVLLLGVVVVVVLAARVSTAPTELRVALLVSVLLALTYSHYIYEDAVGQNRVLAEDQLLGTVVLLSSPRSIRVPVVVTAVLWLPMLAVWWLQTW